MIQMDPTRCLNIYSLEYFFDAILCDVVIFTEKVNCSQIAVGGGSERNEPRILMILFSNQF